MNIRRFLCRFACLKRRLPDSAFRKAKKLDCRNEKGVGRIVGSLDPHAFPLGQLTETGQVPICNFTCTVMHDLPEVGGIVEQITDIASFLYSCRAGSVYRAGLIL